MNGAMCVIRFNKSDSLAHYGIKGQKHGLRRFQNEDRSYTEEGKRRYGIGDGEQRRSDGDAAQAKEQRQAKIKKALAIAGGIAAAAVLGYGIYKGTGLIKKRYIQRATEMSEKYRSMALKNLKESRDVRNNSVSRVEKIIGKKFDPLTRANLQYKEGQRADRMLSGARSYWINSKGYKNMAANATRREAIKNLVKNKGKFNFDNAWRNWAYKY